MMTVFGLKNCDTCRKAVKWLNDNGTEHIFHDVRADGLATDTLARWSEALGWERLLNRRGTTWRGLSETDKRDIDETTALALMVAHPALIKRPVFDVDGHYAVGFDDQTRSLLSTTT